MTAQGFLPDEDFKKDLKPPTMSRSRNQLASSYAPGSFFTFEGGRGACLAMPDKSQPTDEANISSATRDQIITRLAEVWESWFGRAISAANGGRPVDPRLCIDQRLLRDGGIVRPLGLTNLAFVNPLRMSYVPAPLTFVCNHCGLFKAYDTPAELAKDRRSFEAQACRSKLGRTCQWRQLDVVFVHWSGEWAPAMPGRWEWNDADAELRLTRRVCALCHGDRFLLHTQSPRIGEWSFQCANPACNDRRDAWRQNDKLTTEVLAAQSGSVIAARRMEPISYRASSAYYPQSEQFVVFSERDQSLLDLLQEGRRRALGEFIADQFGFGGALPTIDEMQDILLQGGHEARWESYENGVRMRKFAEDMKQTDLVKASENELRKLVEGWFADGLIAAKAELPDGLRGQIARRAEFSSRYDPFSLSVEHEALRRSKLSKTRDDSGRSPFVRFQHLDKDLAPKDSGAKLRQEQETARLMKKLGMAELGMVRDFELCRFTHGYTRVGATPTLEKHGTDLPVRLRMFEPLDSGRRPVYVVTQANEALYVQLDPEAVYNWLAAVGMANLPAWAPSDEVKLGGRLLEIAEPFGRFFSALTEADASTYRYVYTLLHSYAHVLMKSIAEFSGLDVGSLGEYLFPADLAFVVYRNGTTMDLGNLSSLWRNENNRFLGHLLETSTHRCNSGSLCDLHGGACPDCIMVPETSCIAQNRLLSRSVLLGGNAPREDLTHRGQRIPGFLDLLNAPPS
ncbi:hypothetical protein [Polaromonas sp. C04]|uniref:hypothetical protein n=1 Tax=Polaromonas sp. C04 TaxID=1945857 RepID=UPI0009874024|nr:hypothetical protein [Polaromonas sp. C04]OOG58069.1 hypothetical protein B0E49_04365 [Polaromonas sp. C04]